MEARLISCLICPATFDLVDALRTHLLREHGNGVSGETKESGSRSEDASIKDAPALRVSLEHEASFEKSTLVHDEILGLPAQTKSILQPQNECPLESNDPGHFAKQCFKEQTSDLSFVEVKHEVVQDYENRAATGPQEGAFSTPINYLDSSTSLNKGRDTNGAEDLKESIHKTNGSSTDGRRVFKEVNQDGSFILDDSDRRREKKKEVTCVQVNIQVYRLPLCEECGISFRSKELLQAHLDSHNGGIKTTAETCTDSEEMENGQNDLPMREGTESEHVSNGDSMMQCISDKMRDKKLKRRVDLPYEIESDSGTIPQNTEEKNDSLETRTLIKSLKMEKGSQRRFGCSVCSKRFLQKCHLREHMISHTGNYPFKCDVCERKFRRNCELQQHNCHEDQRFVCRICSKSYSQKWRLKEHMTKIHNTKWKCKRNSELKQHDCPSENQATNILKRRSLKKVKKLNKTSQKTKELDGIVETPVNETNLSDTNSCSISLPECTEEINESLEKKTFTSGQKTKKGSERRYACSVCGKRFLQNSHLKEHMISHTKDYPFKCDVCERKFIRNSELKRHNCLEKRRFWCKECSMSFMQKWSLQQHMITHKKVFQFGCDVCERKFSRNSEMKQHNCLGLRWHVNKEKTIVRTQNSEKIKEGIVGLVETPKNEFHLSEANSYSRSERVSENGKILGVTNEPKDLEKETMKLLTEVHLPVKSDIGNTNLRRKSEFITCNICNKDVRNQRRLLRIHRYTHRKKYACEICMKLFVCPSDLKIHMMKHTGERPILCSQCGKGFTCQGKLNSHLKSHSNVKPFKCSTCGESFKTKGALKQHCIRNHTDERTTLCHICGKAFFHLIGLHAHILTHESTRNCKCLICGKAFRNLSQLNQHKLTHSEEKKIKCEFCDYRCCKRSNLETHMRKHTDERPYKCDVCEQTFKRKENKDVHMRIHSGSKPYQCDACDAAFTHYAGLYLHKKRHVHEITK